MLILISGKRKNVPDYEISDEFWNKIKSLLPLPKPKRRLEDLEQMIGKS